MEHPDEKTEEPSGPQLNPDLFRSKICYTLSTALFAYKDAQLALSTWRVCAGHAHFQFAFLVHAVLKLHYCHSFKSLSLKIHIHPAKLSGRIKVIFVAVRNKLSETCNDLLGKEGRES